MEMLRDLNSAGKRQQIISITSANRKLLEETQGV